MPLNFQEADENETCVLSHWAVAAHAEFVAALAWLYLRKPLHASRVIKGLEPHAAGLFGNVKANAVKLLKFSVSDIAVDLVSVDDVTREAAEKKRDARIAHRDGLL